MNEPQAAGIRVRQAAAGDRAALLSMFDRCGPQTRYRRFHGCLRVFPRQYLAEAVSGSALHYALVADAGGQLVALASCRLVDEGLAEIAVLVEDAWQRHGLGSVLLDELVRHARGLGLRALTAQLLAEEQWAAGLLRRYGTGRGGSSRVSHGIMTLTVRLGAVAGDGELSCRPAAARSGSA